MPRIRTVQPHFARSPSMSRVSRDARLLFVLLWTIVDDEGRCRAELDDLARVLYPTDFDAHAFLVAWLGELEREHCIERYRAGDMAYLRIVHWHKHQRIYHPTLSHLPPPPSEGLDFSGIRKTSGKVSGKNGKTHPDQQLGERTDRFPENGDFSGDDSGSIVITNQLLLHHVESIRAAAVADGSHPNALRAVAMMAQFGLPTAKAKEAIEGAVDHENMGPSPADLLGPPDESAR